MLVIEIAVLGISLLGFGVFLASGFKSAGLSGVACLLCAVLKLVSASRDIELTIIARAVAPLLAVPPFVYVWLARKEAAAAERYFDLVIYSGFGLSGWSAAHLWFARNHLPWCCQMMWTAAIVLGAVTALFSVICWRTTGTRHRRFLMVFGPTLLLLYFLGIALKPVVEGYPLSVDSSLVALRSVMGLLVLPAAFFIGNWIKEGALGDAAIHGKVFWIFVAMFAVSYFANNPELTPYLDRIPLIGEGVAPASVVLVLVFPPTVGFLLRPTPRKPRENTEGR